MKSIFTVFMILLSFVLCGQNVKIKEVAFDEGTYPYKLTEIDKIVGLDLSFSVLKTINANILVAVFGNTIQMGDEQRSIRAQSSFVPF